MTEVQRFIGRIRDHYLVGLCKEIATYNQTFNQTSSETLVELNGMGFLPAVYHLHRVDISSNSNSYTDFTEFKSEHNIYFRPAKLSLNNQMKISLEPFVWNEVDSAHVCFSRIERICVWLWHRKGGGRTFHSEFAEASR